MVDVVAASSYTGDKNLQQQPYYEMLYSLDGTNIERIAANLSFWPEDLKAKHTEIKALEKKPRLAFREWSASPGASRSIRRTPGKPGPAGGTEGSTYEEMMMMMMQENP